MTVHDCVDRAARILTRAGFSAEEARRDISVLGRHLRGWTTAQWAIELRDAAPIGFLERLEPLATRRSRHEPVAYITGTREFYGRPFQVSPAVLIPRPETEGIVAEALDLLGSEGQPPTIVDVGTGSGCIAVTLALECPRARVLATDISPAALDVAVANAKRLGAWTVEIALLGSADFVPSDLAGIDLIVSNPPYVPHRDLSTLTPDVRDFEPAGALFGGDDGLDVIRRLIPVAAKALRTGGRLLMEIGAGQADAVANLVTDARLDLAGIRPDLQGIPRIVSARKPAG